MSSVAKNFFSATGMLIPENEDLKALANACPQLFAALAGLLQDEDGGSVPPARLTLSFRRGRLRATLIPEGSGRGLAFEVEHFEKLFATIEADIGCGHYDVFEFEVNGKSARRGY